MNTIKNVIISFLQLKYIPIAKNEWLINKQIQAAKIIKTISFMHIHKLHVIKNVERKAQKFGDYKNRKKKMEA